MDDIIIAIDKDEDGKIIFLLVKNTLMGHYELFDVPLLIERIEEYHFNFYVIREGVKVKVAVRERQGAKYLATEPDYTPLNNLGNLPSLFNLT